MSVTINGTTGITTPDVTTDDLTISNAVDASATGIYLGGTASANLLDDYATFLAEQESAMSE